MLKIYLARHGQDRDNANGILNGRRNEPLAELGLEQAQGLAREIQAHGLMFDAVYSSPLARAYTTAKTVTNALGLGKPLVMPDLVEREFGVMTGRSFRDIEALRAPESSRPIPSSTSCRPRKQKRSRNWLNADEE